MRGGGDCAALVDACWLERLSRSQGQTLCLSAGGGEAKSLSALVPLAVARHLFLIPSELDSSHKWSTVTLRR